ncbi:hypothetical protein [Pseudomonas huanghezhanensis]|uniref:hypothetical protein n=1 Tax=Pseudomonas huanghezhanensis TaxID=3002903 RepID=UPI002285C152|nr:hypothetical protein [Pseudomonas sp. BSw22131]
MKYSRRLAVFLSLIGGLLCNAAQAEEPFILGIGTHLMNFEASPRKPLALAADAGITALKDDAFWSTAEPAPNQLRIVPQWRSYLNIATTLNLSRLTILDYSTSFHNNAKPREGKVKAAYLNYVNYVTAQLGNRVDYYEIWNEWDLEAPKDAKLAADYAALVRDAVPLIRKHTVGQKGTPAKILAGSITPEGMDYGFADHLIDAGMLDLIDGLSVHPYAHCAGGGQNNPESWVNWMRQYERHIREKAGRDVPIYLTEMAWPSHTGACGNTPATQAAYMARIMFFARTIPNIKGMWWYDLINDGPNRTDQEHNFGLLNEDLSPKPAYDVMKVISPFIKDFTYEAASSTWDENLYMLHFKKGKEQVVVAWSGAKVRDKTLVGSTPQAGAVQLIDTAQPQKGWVNDSTSWQCQGAQCSAAITLTEFPKIIRLNTAN